ncbi:unnamed protein product, partial [Vitis vinifera]
MTPWSVDTFSKLKVRGRKIMHTCETFKYYSCSHSLSFFWLWVCIISLCVSHLQEILISHLQKSTFHSCGLLSCFDFSPC